MKNISSALSLLLALLAISLSGCSADSSSDLSDILASVPSDAGAVAAVNLKELCDDAGFDVTDGGIVLSPEAEKAVASADDSTQRAARLIFSSGNGVATSSLVVFSLGYNIYITGLLDDAEAFRQHAAKVTGEKFSAAGKAETAGCVAICDNRFWIASSPSALTADMVTGFSDRPRNRSFLSSDYAEEMLRSDSHITALADIPSLMALASGHYGLPKAGMLTGFLFDDASYVSLRATFGRGKAEADMEILDSKLRTSRFQLPLGKVAAGTVESLGGSADMVWAAAIPHALVMKISDLGKTFGGSLDAYLAPLMCIDGTVAGMSQPGEKKGTGPLRMVVDINDGPTAALTSLLDTWGSVKRSEKTLTLTSDTKPSGRITSDVAAAKLKGAAAGVMTAGMPGNAAAAGKADHTLLLLRHDGGGLRISGSVKMLDSKQPTAPLLFGFAAD